MSVFDEQNQHKILNPHEKQEQKRHMSLGDKHVQENRYDEELQLGFLKNQIKRRITVKTRLYDGGS